MYVDIRNSLEYHLQYNHYPPVDLVFVDAAIEAIENVKGGHEGFPVVLPNGLTKSSEEIVEDLHLEFYLEEPDDEEN